MGKRCHFSSSLAGSVQSQRHLGHHHLATARVQPSLGNHNLQVTNDNIIAILKSRSETGNQLYEYDEMKLVERVVLVSFIATNMGREYYNRR